MSIQTHVKPTIYGRNRADSRRLRAGPRVENRASVAKRFPIRRRLRARSPRSLVRAFIRLTTGQSVKIVVLGLYLHQKSCKSRPNLTVRSCDYGCVGSMRKAVKWALVAAVGFVPVGANAATYVFDFSTTDSLFTVTSAITTADTLNAVGGYDVLSVSGTISGPGGGAIAWSPTPRSPFPTIPYSFNMITYIFPPRQHQLTRMEFCSALAATIIIYIRMGRLTIFRQTIPRAAITQARWSHSATRHSRFRDRRARASDLGVDAAWLRRPRPCGSETSSQAHGAWPAGDRTCPEGVGRRFERQVARLAKTFAVDRAIEDADPRSAPHSGSVSSNR